jgi:hypothetical protein
LYGIIVSTLIGWSIPSIVSWRRSKSDFKELKYFHQKIQSLYNGNKKDEVSIELVNELKTVITAAYFNRKINENHYGDLKNELSILYDRLLRYRIDSLKTSSDSNISKLDKLKEIIEDTYSEQKILEQQFNLLVKKIQDIENHENKN